MNHNNNGMITNKFIITVFGLASIVAILALVDSQILNQAISNVVDKKYVYTVGANRLHEECFPMKAGERLTFSFQSNEVIDFNIHYHNQNKVHYPLKIDRITELEKTVKVTENFDYCLMWKNNQNRMTTISYNFNVNK